MIPYSRLLPGDRDRPASTARFTTARRVVTTLHAVQDTPAGYLSLSAAGTAASLITLDAC